MCHLKGTLQRGTGSLIQSLHCYSDNAITIVVFIISCERSFGKLKPILS